MSQGGGDNVNNFNEQMTHQTDKGTVAGIIIVLILGAIIILIMVYHRFYRRYKRRKTELAHVHYIADPSNQPDRHHFDNPVYATSFTGGPGPGPAAVSSTHLPLNNGCSRVVNHFNSSGPPAKNNNINIERQKLGIVKNSIHSSSYVEEDEDEEEDSEQQTGAFGCAAGAFSYSTLSNRKNFEADAHNPNLYSSLEDIKDNRKMENIYDQIQKRASTSSVQRRASERVLETNLDEEEDGGGGGPSTRYDRLDFTRPSTGELKPHYHSTSTLKSVKSKSRVEQEETEDDTTANNLNTSCNDYIDAKALTILDKRASSGHLSQGEIPKIGDFSREVLQSLGVVPVAPPRVPPAAGGAAAHIQREPDSGISSARSTTTVPWSHNEADIPAALPILQLPPDSSGEAEHQF